MRYDLNVIKGYVAQNSQVLDLGCGDGSLLACLRGEKSIQGVGLENNPVKIGECLEKNVAVVEYDLNQGLSDFDGDSYDLVIMTLTLQAIERPDRVLEEMLRVGRKCIVSFPNFGHWKARWYLALYGRMPVSDLLSYEWYNTPNIHFCTIKDFESLCADKEITILNRDVIASSPIDQYLSRWCPNLFSETAIYHLTKAA